MWEHIDEKIFTLATVDNFDKNSRHAMVRSGSQPRGYHGTTIMIIQPDPRFLVSNHPVGQQEVVNTSNLEALPTDQNFIETPPKDHVPNPSVSLEAPPITYQTPPAETLSVQHPILAASDEDLPLAKRRRTMTTSEYPVKPLPVPEKKTIQLLLKTKHR